MKNRAFLSIMELVVMLLVFAIAATLCLQCFVLSHRLSLRQAAKDRGVTLVQNTAETLKENAGDFARTAALLGGQNQENCLFLSYDSNWASTDTENAVAQVRVIPVQSDTPLLGSARILFVWKDETLYEIMVAWQEVKDHDIV